VFEDEELFTSELAKTCMMGPNSFRIIAELLRGVEIKEGARVLDLGCGRGLTSIYLAKKFNVTVFATDLWIAATENYERFKSLGLEGKIIPIHAEAHSLPFSDGYFDIVVSVDAYHYFGTEADYLPRYLLPLLKTEGLLFIGVPGLKKEFADGVPKELVPYWEEEMNFHSCEWWTKHLTHAPSLGIEGCFELACMETAWDEWLACENEHAIEDRAMMNAEGGNYFNLVGIRARNRTGQKGR